VRAIKKATGADYALFSWCARQLRERRKAGGDVVLAFVGVGLGGGMQVGYASLVDLNTGQVLWFNACCARAAT